MRPSTMDFDVKVINNNNLKIMDKKRMVLNKYFAEMLRNKSENFSSPENTLTNSESNHPFQPLTSIDQHDISKGARKKERYNNDLHQDRFLPHQQMEIKSESLDTEIKSESLDNPLQIDAHGFNSSNDYIPKFDSMKLESDSTNSYSYLHPVIKNERSPHSDNLSLYADPQYNQNNAADFYGTNEFGTSEFGASNSLYDDPLAHHELSVSYPSMKNESGYENVPSQSIYGYYHDESSWDEVPLDLSIPKEEGSPYNSMTSIGEYLANPSDFSLKEESSEENSWLKKIKTGTRSRVRSPKSWEFLLRLLMDPRSNPSMIKWEEESTGTFRLVQKDEIAKIWGMRSNKHKDGGLSYDNFARNLRYHYKTKMLLPVSEKHLVYRFSSEVMEKRHSFVN